MTPADIYVPLTVLILYGIAMGRALLWRLADLSDFDILLGPIIWIASVFVAWMLVVVVSLQAGLIWMAR